MRRQFRASVSREGRWYVAQCLDVDVASQGRTAASALRNLEEALALHFSPPFADAAPRVYTLQLDLKRAS
jgi:predicted RNase H-like HicB family nuclease